MKQIISITAKKFLINVVAILLLSSNLFYAQTPTGESLFEKGNEAYNEGDFGKAVALYEKTLKKGQHSAALYFNLGNAYYRLNNIAESIFYFEKAKLLDPNSEAIKINSAFAQNMTIDAIEPLPESQLLKLQNKILNLLSLNSWGKFAVVLIWLFVILFLGYIFLSSPVIKRSLFFSALLVALCFMGIMALGIIKNQQEQSRHDAILFSNQIDVWSEPNAQGELLFTLHEGTKVEWLDTLENWYKIRIANGSEGWIKNGELRSLKENPVK